MENCQGHLASTCICMYSRKWNKWHAQFEDLGTTHPRLSAKLNSWCKMTPHRIFSNKCWFKAAGWLRRHIMNTTLHLKLKIRNAKHNNSNKIRWTDWEQPKLNESVQCTLKETTVSFHFNLHMLICTPHRHNLPENKHQSCGNTQLTKPNKLWIQLQTPKNKCKLATKNQFWVYGELR